MKLMARSVLVRAAVLGVVSAMVVPEVPSISTLVGVISKVDIRG